MNMFDLHDDDDVGFIIHRLQERMIGGIIWSLDVPSKPGASLVSERNSLESHGLTQSLTSKQPGLMFPFGLPNTLQSSECGRRT